MSALGDRNPEVKRVEREAEEEEHEHARARRAETREELKEAAKNLVPEVLRPGKADRRKSSAP